MSVVNMAKNIKEIHPYFIVCFKVGSFYHCYFKDAYIMSYLFKYAIKTSVNNGCVIGFPKSALPKVMARLEREKINYMIIDTRNEYDVDENTDYKNLNNYEKIYEISYQYIKIKRRIDKITEALFEEINKASVKEKIRKIEEILDES